MSFEFEINKSQVPAAEAEPIVSEEAFKAAVARFAVDYPREWPMVLSAMSTLQITPENRDKALARISQLLAALKYNPGNIASQTRIDAAIADLKADYNNKDDYKKAA